MTAIEPMGDGGKERGQIGFRSAEKKRRRLSQTWDSLTSPGSRPVCLKGSKLYKLHVSYAITFVSSYRNTWLCTIWRRALYGLCSVVCSSKVNMVSDIFLNIITVLYSWIENILWLWPLGCRPDELCMKSAWNWCSYLAALVFFVWWNAISYKVTTVIVLVGLPLQQNCLNRILNWRVRCGCLITAQIQRIFEWKHNKMFSNKRKLQYQYSGFF
jgi:hypothetical protein